MFLIFLLHVGMGVIREMSLVKFSRKQHPVSSFGITECARTGDDIPAYHLINLFRKIQM